MARRSSNFDSSVFVDAAAWIALLNVRDAMHTKATTIYEGLIQRRMPLVTTEFVLLEVADALSAPAIRRHTIAVLDSLRQPGILQIVPVSPELLAQGWDFYCSRLDKEWGLTDCISFTVMQDLRITVAFTSDKHFVQAGYQRLL